MGSDSEGKLLAYSFIGFFLGLYYFIRAFRLKREKALIENTPTSKIRSLAMGPVEVYGSVKPYDNKLIRSTFSNTPCVYCIWLIEKYHSGKNGGWKHLKKGKKHLLFNISDETGTVLVNPKNADVNLPADKVFLSKDGFSDVIKEFFKKKDISLKGWFGDHQLRVTEYYLAPDDQTFIYGIAADNPYVEDGSSEKNEVDIMIKKGDGDFFLISDKHEKDVLEKYTTNVYMGLYGGLGLMLVCLFVIFLILGIL